MKISTNEDCEDGNIQDGDGCDSTCKFEVGWGHSQAFITDGNLTTSTAICGDGLAVGNETCDDRFIYCLSDCESSEPGWTCELDDNSPPLTICHPTCGDNILIGDEQCENGEAT